MGKDKKHGFEDSYSIVKHFVLGKKDELNEKATVRFETIPGLQAQVDWAFFEDHLVLEGGQQKILYCFLMVLGYSRMRYIEFVADMSTNTLIRCHQNAFQYFHGYPEEILYDNMKQASHQTAFKAGGQYSESPVRGFCGILWLQA